MDLVMCISIRGRLDLPASKVADGRRARCFERYTPHQKAAVPTKLPRKADGETEEAP
jgi:hypothetical protein